MVIAEEDRWAHRVGGTYLLDCWTGPDRQKRPAGKEVSVPSAHAGAMENRLTATLDIPNKPINCYRTSLLTCGFAEK